MLQRYSVEGKIRQICTVKFSSPQIVFEFAKVCVCVCVCVCVLVRGFVCVCVFVCSCMRVYVYLLENDPPVLYGCTSM